MLLYGYVGTRCVYACVTVGVAWGMDRHPTLYYRVQMLGAEAWPVGLGLATSLLSHSGTFARPQFVKPKHMRTKAAEVNYDIMRLSLSSPTTTYGGHVGDKWGILEVFYCKNCPGVSGFVHPHTFRELAKCRVIAHARFNQIMWKGRMAEKLVFQCFLLLPVHKIGQ